MAVVRALWTGHVSQSQMILKNDLFEDTHPLVVAHPDWFSTDLLPIAHRGPEEVRRGPGRPRKIETTEQNIEVTQ